MRRLLCKNPASGGESPCHPLANGLVRRRTSPREKRKPLIHLFVAATEDEVSFWFAMISSHDHHHHRFYHHHHHHLH